MPKDVDLSSKEWCDLIFEGKNKDFGAYVIRTGSVKRHTKAVIYTLIGLAIVGVGIFSTLKIQQLIAEQRLKDQAEQENVAVDLSTKEAPKEEQQQKLEEEKPEIKKEEVLQSVKVTELNIVEDSQVKKEDEIKSQDELKDENKAFGQKDNDEGVTDRNLTKTLKNEVVVDEVKPVEEKKAEPEQVFKSVEQMPTFPGGDAALMKYLSSHLQYPTMAQENGVQGTVVVQFVVTKTGKVGEVKVVRSVDRDLDKEATRVCRSLPNFVPGRQNGQAVNVWYTLPVKFKLQQ